AAAKEATHLRNRRRASLELAFACFSRREPVARASPPRLLADPRLTPRCENSFAVEGICFRPADQFRTSRTHPAQADLRGAPGDALGRASSSSRDAIWSVRFRAC